MKRSSEHQLNLAERRAVYVRRARRALLLALIDGDTATMDDVRFAVELPTDINPTVFGCVPSVLARAGIIRAIGYDRTCRPTGHARPITVWMLADREAAIRWLAAHPNLPERGDGSQGSLSPTHTLNEPTPTADTAGAGMEV